MLVLLRAAVGLLVGGIAGAVVGLAALFYVGSWSASGPGAHLLLSQLALGAAIYALLAGLVLGVVLGLVNCRGVSAPVVGGIIAAAIFGLIVGVVSDLETESIVFRHRRLAIMTFIWMIPSGAFAGFLVGATNHLITRRASKSVAPVESTIS